ncbi:MAG: thiol:disulfide interchange protein [Brevundimonas sp.]|uniref:protein-disulfide reductase DsbD family protein n=1 Tax=Brevundimonas sp. TaxID=1871086 RepID=UPI000DB51F1C|nr:thioredoxin family protein [Brevundimonas sp.]PZU76299.1 MAG: thiol:disulfide interchange protein [Brevundimonas sp.]
MPTLRPFALLAALILAVLAPTVHASAAVEPAFGAQRTERIAAELVPMTQWATPGSTVVVAVRQDIQPGWHTYWRNPGDSGGATTLDWTLPAGVKADPILWPLPTRQRLLGLMNYGYSGEVFLPVPIQVPASARPGEILTLTAQALFLVCSDRMCVPEPLTLSLALPVREGTAPLSRPWGEVIRKTVETAPRPAGITAHVTRDGQGLILTATGGPLASGTVGAAYVFPFEPGRIDHAAGQSGQLGPEGLTLRLAPGRETGDGALSGVLATDKGAWEITAEPGPPLDGATGKGPLAPPPEGEATKAPASAPASLGLLHVLGLALLGGLVLNLMPCVFPVLAMKAAALSAAAHDPARARRDGLAFLVGVLVSFLALAGILLALRAAGQAVGWGFQLQSPGVTATLALILLGVGLNLSGVFHVGAGLQGAGSGPLARLPGATGAFFTGVLAVVVAAPCTAPFMAAALGAALVLPWPLALAVFLALGLGLAAPYVAISLSPGLLARLPRPGAWMETLKGVLAFPMYGAALWLTWVFSQQGGGQALAGLLAAGLLLAFAGWTYGRVQARRAEGRQAVAGVVTATLALLLTLMLAGAAAMAARERPAVIETAEAATALASQPWSAQAVAQATAAGRPVLVNLTADWCVTCKINERAALSSPRVAEAIRAANAVYLVGDWTRRDDAITRELQAHGRSGVPLYLVYRPGRDEPEILPQLLTEGVVIEALKGG